MSLRKLQRAQPAVLPSLVPGRPDLRAAKGNGCRDGVPARASDELWLAVHLPHYVLESLRRPGVRGDEAAARAGRVATVVVDNERQGKVVCACDAAAAAAGIAPGMAINSALALAPAVHVRAREAHRERALLEAVAVAMSGFTPRVVLERPDEVLLEVRGSLRLFGGVRRLCAQVRGRLESLGVEPRLALTPTPLASLWFARTGEEVALRRPDGLPGRLASLPLECTRWPARSLQSLATMGVRTVGDCLRLPRDGFARRFEPGLLRSLDQAVGREPDPRATFVPGERFAARRDLEPELADAGQLGRAVEPLLVDLCAFLRRRGRGIQTLELRLEHRAVPATKLRLRFVEPVAQARRIAELLGERLARVELPEPVRALGLRSGRLAEVREYSVDLFALDRRRSSGVPQLVERLRARLGAEAVQGVGIVPEHRPESAWRIAEPGKEPGKGDIPILSERKGDMPISGEALRQKSACPLFRPLWLLAEPQLLGGGERPRYEGALEIEEGPERIESGWWDGHDVRRDYYVARTQAGVRLWVFHERTTQGRWFLHGIFG